MSNADGEEKPMFVGEDNIGSVWYDILEIWKKMLYLGMMPKDGFNIKDGSALFISFQKYTALGLFEKSVTFFCFLYHFYTIY